MFSHPGLALTLLSHPRSTSALLDLSSRISSTGTTYTQLCPPALATRPAGQPSTSVSLLDDELHVWVRKGAGGQARRLSCRWGDSPGT